MGVAAGLTFLDGENPQVGIRALGRGLSAVVDSERMVLCEEEVVTIIKNKIPLQLGKQGLSLLFSLRGRRGRVPATSLVDMPEVDKVDDEVRNGALLLKSFRKLHILICPPKTLSSKE